MSPPTSSPNEVEKLIVMKNKDDVDAAIYFLENDKRSKGNFYKYGSYGLIISEEQAKLLKEINIPFFVQKERERL